MDIFFNSWWNLTRHGPLSHFLVRVDFDSKCTLTRLLFITTTSKNTVSRKQRVENGIEKLDHLKGDIRLLSKNHNLRFSPVGNAVAHSGNRLLQWTVSDSVTISMCLQYNFIIFIENNRFTREITLYNNTLEAKILSKTNYNIT